MIRIIVIHVGQLMYYKLLSLIGKNCIKKNIKQINIIMSEKIKEQEKLTYEQLEQAANTLLAQNNELKRTLVELSNAMRRLDYLFKVLEQAHFFSDDFVTKCVAEIEQLMTIPETPNTDEKEEVVE